LTRRLFAGSATGSLLLAFASRALRRKMFMHPLLDPRRSEAATLSTESLGPANVLKLVMIFSDDL
jgi:hypothetical protein